MYQKEDVFWTKEVSNFTFAIIIGCIYYILINVFSALLSAFLVGTPQTDKEAMHLYVFYLEVSFYVWILVSCYLIFLINPFKEKTPTHKTWLGVRLFIAIVPIITGFAIMAFSHKESWYVIGAVTSSIMLFATVYE